MNDIVNTYKITNDHQPISPQVETAMRSISESFMDLRSAVNKSHYGIQTDIKGAVNRLLACVVDMAEVVE